MMMRRMLVLRGGALGDFIVTLPALKLLRERWPEARIELIGNTTAAELGIAGGLLDRVHAQHEQRWAALHGPGALPADLADWLGTFDLVLNYWPDPEGALHRHFPVKEGQCYLWGEALPKIAPAAAHYCEPLRQLGLTTTTFRHALMAGHGDGPARAGIALHPGSGSPRKNWPHERWLELIPQLPPVPILVILGEAELERWSAVTGGRALTAGSVSQQLRGRNVQLAVNRPLPVLAQQLRHCRLFVGHDSGISHLAASLDVPALLLFGPGDPAMWAPPGPHVKVIDCGPDLASVSVEKVRSEISAYFSADVS